MTASIMDSLKGLFSIASLISFLFGVGSTVIFFKFEDWQEKRKCEQGRPFVHKFRSLWVLWALIFILTGYIGMEENTTAHEVRQLAEDTRQCQRDFFSTITIRGNAGDATDEFSRQKTQAIADWLRTIVTPPPDMALLRATDPNNPKYQQWALDTTTHYLSVIDTAEKAQEASIADRKQHPYPEPSCGK